MLSESWKIWSRLGWMMWCRKMTSMRIILSPVSTDGSRLPKHQSSTTLCFTGLSTSWWPKTSICSWEDSSNSAAKSFTQASTKSSSIPRKSHLMKPNHRLPLFFRISNRTTCFPSSLWTQQNTGESFCSKTSTTTEASKSRNPRKYVKDGILSSTSLRSLRSSSASS